MKNPRRLRLLTRSLLAPVAACFAFALTCTAQPPAPGEETTEAKPLPGAEVVDYTKLLPLLPEPPAGWKADEAEGSTDNIGETSITNVHRDYQKGEGGDGAPTTAISILDSASNPEYVESTTAAWDSNVSDAEGYTKTVTIDGLPGFETFEIDGKHGTLWVMVAKRYFLQIETTGQEASALQEWVKRVDLKKLAEIK
ncbi:hypothetical protein BH20VER1_BH20VER1_31930 [soil metagenome]